MQRVEEKKELEQIELPCIFDALIKQVCPIRKALQEDSRSTVNKYIKPKTELLGELKEIAGMAMKAMKPFAELTILPKLCTCCPFLALYIDAQRVRVAVRK